MINYARHRKTYQIVCLKYFGLMIFFMCETFFEDKLSIVVIFFVSNSIIDILLIILSSFVCKFGTLLHNVN